jgi:hypothetical protein
MAGGHPVPANNRVVRASNGSEVRMRPNGRPGDVHIAGRNMDIHHGLNGNRRIEVERADHSRLVSERGGRGYIQRPYRYGGRDFARRSYYYHGRAYDHYYGHYYYRGHYVDYYTPAYYYRPAFYGWAYNPWVAPVPYAWGWAGNPWYGYYGVFFTPYPVYPNASLWLTDYLISVSLASAYEAQVQLAAAQAQQGLPPDAAPLSPDVKALISAEVQRQIALENSEAQAVQANPAAVTDPASSSVQRMLTDNIQHIFIVGHDIDVINSAGAECAVSQGDALQLAGPPPADSPTASLIVLSSKGGVECHRSETVQVQITDLQEMQNHMRQTIDAGMGDMQKAKGLPAPPQSASGEPIKASFVSTAPPADTNVGAELNQQMQEADIAEKQTLATLPAGSGDQQVASATTPQAAAAIPPPPVTPTKIELGQTIDSVTGALGQPSRIVDLGAKKIYVYKDIKITFKEGKVANVE